MMSHSSFVQAFREAAPYIHYLHGKTIVLAVSSHVLRSECFSSLARDIALLNSLGVRMVIVHGVRAFLEEYGMAGEYWHGHRITDKQSMSEIKRICGSVRLDIEAALGMGFLHTPAHTVKLSVAGGNFISAQPLGVLEGVDMQLTGQVRKIDVEAITRSLNHNQLVLISPVGHSLGGITYNLPLPETATAVALALNAEKLVFLSHTSGICDGDGKVLLNLSHTDAQKILQQYPQHEVIERIVPLACEALKGGVHRVQIIDGTQDGSLLDELFTRSGVGTALAYSSFMQIRKALASDIPELMRLIEPLVREGILLPRNQDDLEKHIQDFFVAEYDDLIVGCASLKTFENSTMGEISCLAVSPNMRKHGYGDLLLEYIEDYAQKHGITHLLALTTRTADWFVERGFDTADASILPQERLSQYRDNKRNSKVFVKPLTEN